MDLTTRSPQFARTARPCARRSIAVATAEEVELTNIELARRVGFTLTRGSRGVDADAAQDLADILGLDWPDWRAGLLSDLHAFRLT